MSATTVAAIWPTGQVPPARQRTLEQIEIPQLGKEKAMTTTRRALTAALTVASVFLALLVSAQTSFAQLPPDPTDGSADVQTPAVPAVAAAANVQLWQFVVVAAAASLLTVAVLYTVSKRKHLRTSAGRQA
jgi:hypothetical protein